MTSQNRSFAQGEPITVSLDLTGLEDLGDGWTYEGWLIDDGAPVSTGIFTVDGNGVPSQEVFSAMISDEANVGAFVLTIEPDPDPDPAPSDVHILAGDFANGMADLSIGHGAALGNDFTGATGEYILAVPSDDTGTGSYQNGIWWLDPADGPGPGLDLPTLPAGWVYEGWVVNENGPVSTGWFTSTMMADSDGAGTTGGGNPAPPFPGQDFINPLVDLTDGYAAVISIEPFPDNSPAPFTLKPLVDATIDDVGEGMVQMMANNAMATSPTGYATLGPLQTVRLSLDLTGLEDLGDGWTYEGWLIDDGAPVSTGVFTVDGDGVPSQAAFSVMISDEANVGAFVLTIEPDPDPDPAPSDVHILAGDFANGMADLSIGHGAALGNDFTGATGEYILAVPSDDTGTGSYQNGIWWLDPADGPGPGLDLPTLPAGWVYEGWVVNGDGPVSTGWFTSTVMADSDGAGATGGANPAPPFPGQDFINPLVDLTDGYAAVISIEPFPDNSSAPFTLKPLVDGTIDDVGEGVVQMMANNAMATSPTGYATLGPLQTVQLSLELTGLEDLGEGWAYEGWLIDDGAPVSTGVFTVDGEGVPSQEVFSAMVSDEANVGAFVLTIEPDPDPDPAPSDVHILAGDLANGMADLSIGHGAALGNDFTGATGEYILAVPSDDTGTGSYQNGIWWLDPADGPGPGLDLPTLPAGWVYEGWVVNEDGPVSTGWFTSTVMADSDGAGATGGANPAPPFPGQDFINPLVDLTDGYAAVISIEPFPDNSSAPFTLKPLVDGTIDDVGEGVVQMMGNNAANTSPTGSVVLSSVHQVYLPVVFK